MATTPAKRPARDPQEFALRQKLKALERKYDGVSESWQRSGRGEGPIATRMRALGKQIDDAQKALDDYLARRT